MSTPIKIFKNGNSQAFRVTKNDLEQLDATPTTEFEKTISPDEKTISFTKIDDTVLQKTIDLMYTKYADVMDALENE